ncbi:Trehalose-6-phosphate phosphatase [hydrothermal vent metagenome]|uniref:Trehalose-6-phosphate phosphatase n=1 Tax=hydrothermal vent metagenome TaxID=652676 RepID=A0A3B0RIR2_9ZZZZ
MSVPLNSIDDFEGFAREVFGRKLPGRRLSERRLSERRLSERRLSERRLSERRLSERRLSERRLSERRLSERKLSLFLDFDGTLAPIAETPALAELPLNSREVLSRLSLIYPVVVISGRGLADIMEKVGLANITYGANHGMTIRSGPSGTALRPSGTALRPSGTALRPSGTALRPSGTALRPSGTALRPSGTTLRPSETASQPSGMTPGSSEAALNGFEMDYDVGADRLAELRAAVKVLGAVEARYEGLVMEDKGATLSLHYRQLAGGQVEALMKELDNELAPFKERGLIRVTGGKKVIELRPNVDWNKGRAVEWILEREPFASTCPIYIGDDETDRDGFRAVRGIGVSVYVGAEDKEASYHMEQSSVVGFLSWLIAFAAR